MSLPAHRDDAPGQGAEGDAAVETRDVGAMLAILDRLAVREFVSVADFQHFPSIAAQHHRSGLLLRRARAIIAAVASGCPCCGHRIIHGSPDTAGATGVAPGAAIANPASGGAGASTPLGAPADIDRASATSPLDKREDCEGGL